MSVTTPMPMIGEIRAFAAPVTSSDWVLCDGRMLDPSDMVYNLLFSVIGTAYGGNGADSFAVPDLRARAIVHPEESRPWSHVGDTGGSQTVILTTKQLPRHTHSLLASQEPAVSYRPDSKIPARGHNNWMFYIDETVTNMTVQELDGDTIIRSGGGRDHPNEMPTMGMYYFIACKGVFPKKANS